MKKTRGANTKRKPRTTAVVKAEPKEPMKFDAGVVSDLVLNGDLRQFSPEQKVKYYTGLCQSLKLNPLTRPFQLIVLNNKETLYATRDAAEQLRKINGVSVIEMKKEREGDLYVVTVKVQDNTGRYDMASGAVNLKGLSGDMLANKIMTAETKAKRRATLSICGLGMLDETEVDTIPGAHKEPDIPGLPVPAEQNHPENDDIREQKAREAVEKLDGLPEDIKEGFRLLGYLKKSVWEFCEMYSWDNAKIKAAVNSILDKKAK